MKLGTVVLAVGIAGCAALPSSFRNAIDFFGSGSRGGSAAAGGSSGVGGASPPGGGATAAPAPPSGTLLATVAVGQGPRGMAFDSAGHLWVALHDSNSIVSLTGSAVSPRLSVSSPTALAFDSFGHVWIGTDGGIFGFDASGSPLAAAAGSPVEAVTIAGGMLFATYPSEGVVRRFPIASSGLGTGTDLPATGGEPHDLVFDSTGRLWVAAGSSNQVARYDQPLASGSVAVPVRVPCGFDAEGLAVSATGSVYVLGNSTIASVSTTEPAVVAQDSHLVGAVRMASDAKGRFWAAGRQINQLVRVVPPATVSPLAPTLSAPYDVQISPAGSVWVSSEGNGSVYEFSD
ncbi:MAG: hypothetical protein KGR26_04495 [Cyanobacteria bacterium REEB65]|nr:hypothetical protein [Cyanobacteria bacterium REEB65]